MKKSFVIKAALLVFLSSGASLAVNAQKISEQQLKVNVAKISNPLDQLKSIDPVVFNYNHEQYKQLNLPAGQQYGFLTENLQAAYPDMVQEYTKLYPSGKNNDKVARYDEVRSADLIPLLVAAVKAQQAEIELLKKELIRLTAGAK